VLQNEYKRDEMSKIMEVLHLPTKAKDKFTYPMDLDTLQYDNTTLFEIMLGGEQLMVGSPTPLQRT